MRRHWTDLWQLAVGLLNFMDEKQAQKIKAINRIFHEVEADFYDQRHPEILAERRRWQNLAEKYLPRLRRPRVVLDVGTGTGFVAGLLAPYLSAADQIICTDISPQMLASAKNALKDFSGRVELVENDGEQLNFLPSGSVSLVALNSVLHHLPDYERLLSEIDRVLQPGGLFCVLHEPNQKFAQSGFLVFISRALNFLNSKFGREKSRAKEDLTGAVNKRLIREGILNQGQELTAKEIQSLVDVWSPTAGGQLNKKAGFDPLALKQKYFSAYEILLCQTYNHLGKINPQKNLFLWVLDKMLSVIFPQSGFLFGLVLRKK